MELTAARQLAETLISLHDIDYQFNWMNRMKAAGMCDYQKRTIYLSRPVTRLNPEEMVRNTILHEIAHALTPGDGHGRYWKEMCRRIGAEPSRLLYADGTTVIAPTPRYMQVCDCCNTHGKGFYRKPRRVDFSKSYCVYCGVKSLGQIFIYEINDKREKIKKIMC